MKVRKTSLIIVAAVCLLAFTGISLYAQGMMGGGRGNGMQGMRGGKGMQAGGARGNGMQSGAERGFGMMGGRGFGINGILEAAGDPLTEEQIALINEIERGPEAQNERMAILTSSQVAALETYREENQGRQGMRGGNGMQSGAERGFGMMGVRGFGINGILEAAGVPLTAEQIALIKEIERGPEAQNEQTAILTATQIEALETYREENPVRQGMRGGRGRQAGGGRGVGMMGGRGFGINGILEAAGDPLTDNQIALISEIERGPEAQDEMMAILTTTQIEILNTHRTERFGDSISVDNLAGDSLEKALDVGNSPEAFSVLKQNYPNPFNPATTIEYQLAIAGDVRIEIYSPSGQLVETLVSEYQTAGLHNATWNASSHSSGIYICRIISGDFISSVKMSYVK
ncbi:T9SS type A sorting domain-containing protein [Candidatus Latescibacterota bacterium]